MSRYQRLVIAHAKARNNAIILCRQARETIEASRVIRAIPRHQYGRNLRKKK